MKYRTIIEIVSEAGDPNEAADIAGEYLMGYIDEGVSMRCSIKRLDKAVAIKVVSGVLMILCFLSISSFVNSRNSALYVEKPLATHVSAIQPPLKTDAADNGFRNEWQTREHKTALDYIRK